MVKTFSKECTAVALYGIDPTEYSISGFYDEVVQWLQELNQTADKMSIDGPGHSGKPVSFEHANARLKKRGFTGITNLFIASLEPDAKIPLNDYLIAADVSVKRSFACVVCRSSFAQLSEPAMLSFAKKIIRRVKPAYGIGYTRPHRLGPLMYDVGICQGMGPNGYGIPSEMTEAEKTESRSISGWADGMRERVWQDGLLRDVYIWNFISEPHLAKQIGGMSLHAWVRQEGSRGTIDSLGKGVFLWKVSESHGSAVRQAVHAAGGIFDAQNAP